MKFQSALPLPLLMILQLNRLSLPLPPPVSNLTLLASSLYASPLDASYCTVLLKALYCEIKSLFSLFFVCLLCIIWVKSIKKSITVQCYIADCVSWVSRLTMLDS